MEVPPDALAILAAVLSVAAFAFSLTTFFLQWRKDRRDLFLTIHQALIAPELQEGRRKLHALGTQQIATVHVDDPDGYQQINRALAMFDIFAMYVERRYISEDLALKEWGHSLSLTWEKAEPFIEARRVHSGYRPWPSLRVLGRKATTWSTNNSNA